MAMVLVIIPMSNVSYGLSIRENEKLKLLLEELSQNNEYFYDFMSYTSIKKYKLSDNNYDLLMYYKDGVYVGYVIWDNINDSVCEISKSINAYDIYIQENNIRGKYECMYTQGQYIIINKNIAIYLNEFGEEYYREDVGENGGISTYKVIPGVVPQLQNSDNCIVAAVSNLIYYYASNGYSSLNPKHTFSAIKADINMLFGGVYANNSIPSVLRNYISQCNSNLGVTSNVKWNPAVSLVLSEVNNNRPCLVGFAAGSPYSNNVGHMTMGCGYEYIGGGNYIIALADGHSSKIVYKTWSSSYNDCVITVKIN